VSICGFIGDLGRSFSIPGGNSRQVWIELCRKARVDPRVVLDNQLDNLLKITTDPLSERKVLSKYLYPRTQIELIY
jgi:hypothetical protein